MGLRLSSNKVPEADFTDAENEVPIPNVKQANVDETHTIEETEAVVGEKQQFGFQAETRKLLDIVARSLYTDKEVFVRELISNASDALEKLRHNVLTKKVNTEGGEGFEILMSTDDVKNTFTIQDFGIGMTKEDLVSNLGTIAHSGTQKFVKEVETGSTVNKDLIGQFGVGFYAVFMVADKVRVYTKSALPGGKGYLWESDGLGSYTVSEAEGVSRGTKIVVYLKRSESTFAKKLAIENIVKKYSNFVNFPIKLNGETVNTVKALWTMPVGSITEDQHKEFYQFIARAYDEPRYSFHYLTDSPLQIQSLFYVPDQHMEKFGMGRTEPGVSLYCRRVLIQSKCKGLLPDWLRFIKGVVDSEDIPLNLSREHLQDSALINRLSSVLTRRVLKFLVDESKHDEDKFQLFFREYGNFLKEGIVTDFTYKEDIAKLLRFESSKEEPEKTISFDAYIDRMPENQQSIYYLCTPSRHFAETSPYYEVFQRKGIEVLFFYTSIDEVVLSNLQNYRGKKLESIESATDLPKDKEEQEEDKSKDETVVRDFSKWVKSVLEDKVSVVRESSRVSKSPALVVDHESAPMRRIMSKIDPVNAPKLPKQVFEYNINHPIMKRINLLRFNNENFAKTALEQVLIMPSLPPGCSTTLG